MVRLGIRGREYIKDDKASIVLRVAAYVGAFVILIFALNSLNFYLIGLSILPLAFLLAAEAIGLKAGSQNEPPSVPKGQIYRTRFTQRQQQSVLLGVAASLIVFAGYWYAAPALFGLPSAVFGSLVVSSGILTAFSIDAVYSFSEAVAEERFVRFAAVNGVIYLTGNAWFGLGGSILIFWAIHVSRYWNDPQAQGLILVSGSFLGYIDILYRSILVSTPAHVIWNLAVSAGTALVVAAPGLSLGALLTGTAVFVVLPVGVFVPVAAVLAWRRPDLFTRMAPIGGRAR